MADAATLRARNADFWAKAAPGWARQADRHDELGRPLGVVALDRLRPQPGERVLDVGCGCGGTTAEIARAVAPLGSAVGIDLAEAMVATARARFTGHDGAGLRFVAGDVETLDVVPGAPFDAVYSRMTLMLLADPVAGLSTVRRSMRAGARLAATVFRDGPANPWLPAAMLGAAAHLGPLPPLPIGDEPGPFAFADAARVTRLLTAAGFATSTSIRTTSRSTHQTTRKRSPNGSSRSAPPVRPTGTPSPPPACAPGPGRHACSNDSARAAPVTGCRQGSG